jgi:hypothetical protein
MNGAESAGDHAAFQLPAATSTVVPDGGVNGSAAVTRTADLPAVVGDMPC